MSTNIENLPKVTQYLPQYKVGAGFDALITKASLRSAASIEGVAQVYSEVIKLRQQKLSTINELLAELTAARLSLRQGDEPTSGDTTGRPVKDEVKARAAEFGITGPWNTRREITEAEERLKAKLDEERNNIQQNVSSLQNYISKRDNAYSMASSFEKKVSQAASDVIKRMS